MASKVGIYNLAAAWLNVPAVSSDTENTRHAVVFQSIWDQVRRKVLRDHTWNHAKKRKSLDQLAESPAFGWDYQYVLPPDVLRVLTLNGEDGKHSTAKWEIEYLDDGTRVLLTDEIEADITYVADIDNVGMWDPALANAMAYELALAAAPSLGKNPREVQQTAEMRSAALADAKAVEGQEGSPQIRIDQTLVDARK